MRIEFTVNEQAVLLNALDALEDNLLDGEDEDVPVIIALRTLIENAR